MLSRQRSRFEGGSPLHLDPRQMENDSCAHASHMVSGQVDSAAVAERARPSWEIPRAHRLFRSARSQIAARAQAPLHSHHPDRCVPAARIRGVWCGWAPQVSALLPPKGLMERCQCLATSGEQEGAGGPGRGVLRAGARNSPPLQRPPSSPDCSSSVRSLLVLLLLLLSSSPRGPSPPPSKLQLYG